MADKLVTFARKLIREHRQRRNPGRVAPSHVWLVEKYLGLDRNGKPVWRAWSHTHHSRDEARLSIERVRRDSAWPLRPARYAPAPNPRRKPDAK